MSEEQQKRLRKKLCHCQNCGEPGHVSRNCILPVTSFGIILFDRDTHKTVDDSELSTCHILDRDRIQHQPPVTNEIVQTRYLLVRRRDSMSYVELLRGKYNPQDVRFIYQMLTEMTIAERDKIRKSTFDIMWHDLWSRSFGNFGNAGSAEYLTAAAKFSNLKKGYNLHNGSRFTLQTALKATKSVFAQPEWGFAKGRRSKKEKDLQCAKREFGEETGFQEHEYDLSSQLGPVSESFRGSNRVFYKHIYFVARSKVKRKKICIDPHNLEQMSEIGDIGWFTCDEALSMFRAYDIEKKCLLMRLDATISNMQE